MSVFPPIGEDEPATQADKNAFSFAYAILFIGAIVITCCVCCGSTIKKDNTTIIKTINNQKYR